MGMRRLNRKRAGGVAAGPPNTAQEPEEAPQLPANPDVDAISALFGFTRGDDKPRASGGGAPYVSTYSGKEKGKVDAVALKMALGGSAGVGTPYLKIDDDIYNLTNAAFVCLDETYYWCRMDSSNQTTEVWMEQRRGAKIKDGVTALMLVLPQGDEEATLTVTDMRGPRCPCIKHYVDAVEDSQEPNWAKQHGKHVASLAPRMRIAARFRSSLRNTKPNEAGETFQYALISADTPPITMDQISKIADWAGDVESQEERVRLEEIYESRVKALRDQAAQ